MVKAYLRYVQEASWGVIVSGGGQVVVDPTGKLAITPALDTVLVWDIKTQAIVHRLVPPGGRPGESSEVTALALASDGETLAAGHANGTIHLWRLSDGEERTVLTGHRSAVTALHFNGASTLLASGSEKPACGGAHAFVMRRTLGGEHQLSAVVVQPLRQRGVENSHCLGEPRVCLGLGRQCLRRHEALDERSRGSRRGAVAAVALCTKSALARLDAREFQAQLTSCYV